MHSFILIHSFIHSFLFSFLIYECLQLHNEKPPIQMHSDEKFWYFLISTQNIDCGYNEAVRTSTHNLCFRTGITLTQE